MIINFLISNIIKKNDSIIFCDDVMNLINVIDNIHYNFSSL